MWNNTATISTSPVIQWIVTQPNSTPMIGRNAVPSSVRTHAAPIQ